jgi:LuxR family transcriptional regulator, maltose regulon positive regulatory protein
VSTQFAADFRPTPRPREAALDAVESTISIPVLRSGLVSRTALVNRFRAQTSCTLALVTAPAGYGKTTVLAQWAGRDPRRFAWVSLDERHDDAFLLLRHIAAALNEIAPLAPDVLAAFEAPGTSIWASALPRLAAALAAAHPLVLVLDDSHSLRSRDSLDAVEVLAAHVAPGSTLVLSGRATPSLPIAALRAAGPLLELGVEQLALTSREGQRLLRSTGVKLPFEEVKTLVRECEGWPAALYLAALSLREHESGTRAGDRPVQFASRDASLVEYFRTEYLSRLGPRNVEFLRRTSILEKMCGGLCDAVLGQQGSARYLEAIEHSNLFLVPLDRRRVWYRYHGLFRDALRQDLVAREPNIIAVLHRRAADWYEAHRDLESSLDHAHAAGDIRRVVRIFTTIALPLYQSGRVATVERWLAWFDDQEVLERYPTAAVQGSWIHALRGRTADAERWLRFAEIGLSRRGHSPDTAAWTKVIRAALCRDGVYQMIADAESALLDLSRDSPARPSALMVLGAGYMLLGHKRRADAILAEAAAEADRLGATETQVVAMGERSVIAAAEQHSGDAEKLAQGAQQLVEEARLEGYATTAISLATSARASLRHGHWDEARADLEKFRALRSSLGRGLFPWLAIQTRIELARVYLALRETPAVRAQLAEIRELLRERPYVGVLVDEAEVLEREVDAIPDREGHTAALTPAELRLLPFLATQFSFREIGEQLYVSRNTIKTQAISVYRKLGVTSRSDAIKCATRLGLVGTEPDAPDAFIRRG